MSRFSRNSPNVNLFVKSSVLDFQDPVYLTFHVDFFPASMDFDGIRNDNLLFGSSILNPNYSTVEWSAYAWLEKYYGDTSDGTSPAQSLDLAITGLTNIQENPWYFQSVQGIADLWKTLSRVKEGNRKSTLTFSCLESIKQPLTKIAEHYRYAIYDNDRASYRLPDNLRWFDMEISLIEIRNIVDRRDSDFWQNLNVTKFRLKQCEFDFSDFIGGSSGNPDYKIYTEDKPFSPSFKVNVGWVEHKEFSNPKDIADLKAKDNGGTAPNILGNLFSGASQALSTRLTNITQTALRLPGAIAGSLITDIQTELETQALGNVYDDDGLNAVRGAINRFGASITDQINGRQAPVGPPASRLYDRVYPKLDAREGSIIDGTITPIVTGDLEFSDTTTGTPAAPPNGNAYPDPPKLPPIPSDLGDVYP